MECSINKSNKKRLQEILGQSVIVLDRVCKYQKEVGGMTRNEDE